MTLTPILDLLRTFPEIASWPEALAYVARAVHREGHSPWEYPGAACRAVGGSAEGSLPAAAAVFCALAAIHLVDDLLDEDPQGDYRRLGPGRAANLALALQAAGHLVLDTAASDHATRAALQVRQARMSLATARGQDLDAVEAADEDGYWQRVEAKSPPLFAAALELGALLGGGTPAAVDAVGRLGAVMGRYIQVSDDLADALKTPATADWGRCRGNLALLYAVTAEHPDRETFLALVARVGDPAALAEAQEILVRSGAVAYCLYHLTLLTDRASAELAAAPLASPEPLAQLLAAQREPLARLLANLGVDLTAAPGER